MVGHHDGLRADLDRLAGVVRVEHALDYDRSLPQFAEPGHVVPGDGRVEQGSNMLGDRREARPV